MIMARKASLRAGSSGVRTRAASPWGWEVGDANPQVRSAGTSERASYSCIGSNFWVSIAAFPEDQAEYHHLS